MRLIVTKLRSIEDHNLLSGLLAFILLKDAKLINFNLKNFAIWRIKAFTFLHFIFYLSIMIFTVLQCATKN